MCFHCVLQNCHSVPNVNLSNTTNYTVAIISEALNVLVRSVPLFCDDARKRIALAPKTTGCVLKLCISLGLHTTKWSDAGHCSCTITGPSCCRLQAAAEHSSFVTSHFMTLKIVKFWQSHLFVDKARKMHVINICTCANLVFWVLAAKVLCNNNDLSAVQTFFVIQTTVGRRKNMYFNNEGFRRIQLKPALDNLLCIMNWKSWKWISRT